jgi:hypothetical protein
VVLDGREGTGKRGMGGFLPMRLGCELRVGQPRFFEALEAFYVTIFCLIAAW